MSTLKQIAANKANALKSTGPRTAEGKAKSRLNALKSGVKAESEIIPHESQSELTDLTTQFHDQFDPATPEECALVDQIVRTEWLLRRMAAVEARWWQQQLALAFDYMHHDNARYPREVLGNDFSRIQWRLNSLQRQQFQAIDRLKALKAAHQATETKPLTEELASFGSTPQIHPEPPIPSPDPSGEAAIPAAKPQPQPPSPNPQPLTPQSLR